MKKLLTCSVPACDTPAVCRGWCDTHYCRWKRHGDPLLVKSNLGVGDTPADRFWSKADRNGPTHPRLGTRCWIWSARKDRNGYGRIQRNRNGNILAHRMGWFYTFGEWPAGDLRHQCDNPACVRPDHLLDGTHAENMRDMAERNMSIKGSGRPTAILIEADIPKIRQLFGQITQRKIATMFGVSEQAISNIKRGTHWRHV